MPLLEYDDVQGVWWLQARRSWVLYTEADHTEAVARADLVRLLEAAQRPRATPRDRLRLSSQLERVERCAHEAAARRAAWLADRWPIEAHDVATTGIPY